MKTLMKNGIIADINTIHDWILDAKKGEEAIYFVGELSRERALSPNTVSGSADYVYAQMSKGLVALKQKKAEKINRGVHEYNYIMERTGMTAVATHE